MSGEGSRLGPSGPSPLTKAAIHRINFAIAGDGYFTVGVLLVTLDGSKGPDQNEGVRFGTRSNPQINELVLVTTGPVCGLGPELAALALLNRRRRWLRINILRT